MVALRICVDARVPGSGAVGGVEQVMIGLASGLSKLGDGDEEYLFLTYPDAAEWLRPYVHGPCRIIRSPVGTRGPRWKQVLNTTVPAARSTWLGLSSVIGPRTIRVPRSDGT